MNQFIKQVLISLGAAIIVVSLSGCHLFPSSGDTVERVSDGDTLVLQGADGNKFTVRFACVDAPEIPHSQREKNSKFTKDINQFTWGIKAQTRVEALVKKSDNRVKLNITDSDRYGRKVAEVRLKDGTFVQQVLLQEGLAKAYRPYLNKCPSKSLVQQAEVQAQQQRIGVWNDAKFVDPWEYRRKANK
ncbi:thermonuclease family protein [Anabaena cylindrica FACHB-243]|uniref:Nuclease (SNase domain-containing protein) n=1 Tax=Anabaena cylindrica (strain ATCC 27899 / PCC 7122) TaxID=272123 RepID=K9ZKW0_ANACC|nr:MULTISPECIES: thermonuclease family protein [Anabaena]AFZ59831.1 nuclease (SNase domain-containing protein) [Anabaena cylindrica PCC 7122]MBD2417230.1 thermonuclease family protein [Anabaena cylindrica FACHB-243]MBY5282314.1 thermonuclease family protein [Anabaena sp. CCAP 1446/1C]MBY5309760.1 thermonuclease family protein [Anabaena sp. CCAP 1446/1C]MCM2404954.1 thermonuclease family protein [Anabaena sp. CCAP 1446/1C]